MVRNIKTPTTSNNKTLVSICVRGYRCAISRTDLCKSMREYSVPHKRQVPLVTQLVKRRFNHRCACSETKRWQQHCRLGIYGRHFAYLRLPGAVVHVDSGSDLDLDFRADVVD